MTLVLTLLTHTYVLQVSDRRSVWPNGNIDEDELNKAVFYCGHLSFAYTGLTRLEGISTAGWFANQVYEFGKPTASNLSPPLAITEALEKVARLATEAVKKVPEEYRGLTWVGAGWAPRLELVAAKVELYDQFQPFGCVISNQDGDITTDSFEYQQWFLEPSGVSFLHPAGEPLTEREQMNIQEDVASILGSDSDHTVMVDLLAARAEQVAERATNVGKQLLVNVLLKDSVVNHQSAAFDCIPRKKKAHEAYSAIVACRGVLFGGVNDPAPFC